MQTLNFAHPLALLHIPVCRIHRIITSPDRTWCFCFSILQRCSQIRVYFIFLQPKWERQVREDLRSTDSRENSEHKRFRGRGKGKKFIRIVCKTNKITWLNSIEYFLKIGPASNLSSLLFHSSKTPFSEAHGVSCSAIFSCVNTCIPCASPSLQCPSVSQALWDGYFFQPQDLNKRKMLGRMWP